MKKLTLITTIALLSAFLGFSQNRPKAKSVVTFNGKAGNYLMSWDEFSKCNKELKAENDSITIKSFDVTFIVLAPNGKDTSCMISEKSTGNYFSSKTKEMLENYHNQKKLGDKIYIENIMVNKDGKDFKVSGINLKLE